jgi:hypothetical protein
VRQQINRATLGKTLVKELYAQLKWKKMLKSKNLSLLQMDQHAYLSYCAKIKTTLFMQGIDMPSNW